MIPRSSTASLIRVRASFRGLGRGGKVITRISGCAGTSVSQIMTSRRGPDVSMMDMVKKIRLAAELLVFTQLLLQGLRGIKIVGSYHVHSSTYTMPFFGFGCL